VRNIGPFSQFLDIAAANDGEAGVPGRP